MGGNGHDGPVYIVWQAKAIVEGLLIHHKPRKDNGKPECLHLWNWVSKCSGFSSLMMLLTDLVQDYAVKHSFSGLDCILATMKTGQLGGNGIIEIDLKATKNKLTLNCFKGLSSFAKVQELSKWWGGGFFRNHINYESDVEACQELGLNKSLVPWLERGILTNVRCASVRLGGFIRSDASPQRQPANQLGWTEGESVQADAEAIKWIVAVEGT